MKLKTLTISGFRSLTEPVEVHFDQDWTSLFGLSSRQRADLADAVSFLAGRSTPTREELPEPDGAGAYTVSGALAPLCEVSMTFDRTVPEGPSYEDLTFSRRLFSSGRTEFCLNGVACDPARFHKLFADRKAGRYGVSLLDRHVLADLQGGRPGSLEALLRRSAGVDEAYEQIRALEEALAADEKACDALDRQYQEIERRRRTLQEEAQRAKEAAELETRLREYGINIQLHHVHQCEVQMEQLAVGMADLEARAAEKQREADRLSAVLQSGAERIRLLEDRAAQSQEQLTLFLGRVGAEQAVADRLDEQIDQIQSAVQYLEEEKTAEKQRIEELVHTVFSLESQVEELERSMEESRRRIQEEEKALHGLREKCSAIEADYVRINDRRIQKEEALKLAEAKSSALKERSADAEARLLFAEEELAAVQTEMYARALEEARTRYRDALRARGTAENRKTAAMQSAEALRERREKLEQAAETAALQLAETRAARQLLEQLDEEYAGYDASVTEVLRAASLKDVFGPAGESLTVARGYEGVIEAALGRHVQDVLCGDADTALAAVNLLQQRRAGWIRLLPADMPAPERDAIPAALLSAEGCLGRALDFVTFDPKYRKAFEWLLGNTILVQNRRFVPPAEQRRGIRVVTMEQEVFDDTGAIEGGARRGGYGSVIDRKSRMRALQAESLRLEKETSRLKSECARIQEELDHAAAMQQEAAQEQAAQERAMDNALFRIDHLSAALHEEEKRFARTRLETDQARTECQRAGAAWSAVQEEEADRRVQVERIHREMEPLQEAAREADGTIRQLEESVRTETRLRQEAENRRDRLRARIEEIQRRIRAQEERIQRLTGQVDERTSELVYRRTDRASLAAKLRSMGEETVQRAESIRKDRVERTDLLATIEKHRGDREVALAASHHLLAERDVLQARRTVAAERIDEAKRRLWDDFGLHYGEALREKKEIFPMQDGVREVERIRNTLQDMGAVNRGAAEALETVTAESARLFRERAARNQTAGERSRELARQKTEAAGQFRNFYERLDEALKTASEEAGRSFVVRLQADKKETPEETGVHLLVHPADQPAARLEYLPEDLRQQALRILLTALLKTDQSALYVLAEPEAVLSERALHELQEGLAPWLALSDTRVLALPAGELPVAGDDLPTAHPDGAK